MNSSQRGLLLYGFFYHSFNAVLTHTQPV
jgi:hypothetical protein